MVDVRLLKVTFSPVICVLAVNMLVGWSLLAVLFLGTCYFMKCVVKLLFFFCVNMHGANLLFFIFYCGMYRNTLSKVYPAMYIENVTELAFDDITPEDPDFSSIQGNFLLKNKKSKHFRLDIESNFIL